MAPYCASRTTAVIIALASLNYNLLSALFFHQLPDDPYHVAGAFGWYLHFASLMSVFGLVGAVRQHAPSIAVFANYLICDTLLSLVPRLLVLIPLVLVFSDSLCSPSFGLPRPTTNLAPPHAHSPSPSPGLPATDMLAAAFTPESCLRTLHLGQIMLGAGALVTTLLQLVGALSVRLYARALWLREMREEEAALAARAPVGVDAMGKVEGVLKDSRTACP